MTPAEIHNKNAGLIVKAIVKPMLEAGGEFTDILVLLETIVAGVMIVAVKSETSDVGDDEVLDALVEGVRERLKEMRLAHAKPKGHA
jgi:hypothetical protein